MALVTLLSLCAARDIAVTACEAPASIPQLVFCVLRAQVSAGKGCFIRGAAVRS